jgi:hypothetical protein
MPGALQTIPKPMRDGCYAAAGSRPLGDERDAELSTSRFNGHRR